MLFKKVFFILFINAFSLAALSKNIYIDSLFYKQYRQPATPCLFLLTAGYRMPVNNNIIINSGRGFYLEGGINPGRYISKNPVLGFYAGYAFMDRFWYTGFDQDFSADLRTSIKEDQTFSELDSSVIYSSVDLIKNAKGGAITLPGCEMRSFHNYSFYYGLALKLPNKYFPILKIYTGTTRSYYLGNGNIATKQKDFNAFQLRRAMYGCELVIFKGVQNLAHKQKLPSNNYIGAFSIYYESCDFYNSTLYFSDGTNKTTIPLKRFTSDSFLTKYKNEVYWGFKLSFYIM